MFYMQADKIQKAYHISLKFCPKYNNSNALANKMQRPIYDWIKLEICDSISCDVHVLSDIMI